MGAIDSYVRHATAPAGDVHLHYVTAGEGPVVLLLHGFPQTWYCWRHQVAALAEAGFRVVAPDMRGFGDSDKPRAVRSYRRKKLVDDVRALADHLGVDRLHLVGHDWGAAVAWYTAIDAPQLVDRLAICNVPHPAAFARALRTREQRRRSWYMFAFQIPWLPERRLVRDDAAILRRMWKKDAPQVFTGEVLERYVAAIRQPGAARGGINYYRAAARYDAWRARRGPVGAPTLVIWGEQDRYLSPWLAEPPPDLVPDARVVRLSEASHWVMEERPEEVASLLVEHLTVTTGRPAGTGPGGGSPAGALGPASS